MAGTINRDWTGIIIHTVENALEAYHRQARICLYGQREMHSAGIDYASMAQRTRIRPKAPPPVYLKAWLSKLDVTQDQLAERIGSNQSTVSRYLSGKREISISAAIAIAEALGIRDIDLYRHPDEESLDALLAGRPEEVRKAVTRYVRAMVESDE
ncbi:helix-turn-helix domain-containing protein [Acuticoccus sediminis]|uniref:helix-turn-helix domain-containing protein n=1 Tax=Acuticoccus sediminis TaxID=2184697 RepID=UPI00384B1FE5